MLFNSYAFLAGFLPVTVAGFFLLGRWNHRLAAGWLTLASLVFYGWWNPRYLPLLLGSIGFNFLAGRLLARRPSRAVLAGAVGANLLLLAYYKYAGFFVQNLDAAFGLSWSLGTIILPLGISFFTFTQIAYLVDVWRGHAQEARLLHYALFVTYFPHLIAGPILHHGEMMPQFARPDVYSPQAERFMTGLAVFAMGLAKKVVLADSIATTVGPVFDAAEAGQHLPLLEAWGGALAYTFQLYFDFSGYCDMAIGLSWLFGIGLPLNFNSPYKALSIVEFWRRWHLTLSRFLRDYLYIALGGNRHGPARRYVNLMLTMLLGGLWHGAGWTFVIWGALHGAYLVVNHVWSSRRNHAGLPRPAAWAVTFLAVVVGWVFFRATTVDGALRLLGGMAGLNGSGGADPVLPWQWAGCAVLAAIALFLPNTEQIMGRFLPAIARPAEPARVIRFAPSLGWATATAAMLAAGLTGIPQPTSFLYFNF